KAHLTRLARADLLEIWRYFADEAGLAVADHVILQIESGIGKVAEHPGLGHLRLDLADDTLRFWPVLSYLVIYRPTGAPVQISRVLHAPGDVRSLLGFAAPDRPRPPRRRRRHG